MARRKWYRKKRNWVLLLLGAWLVITRMEWAKFRYHPAEFRQELIERGQSDVKFHSVELHDKKMAYVRIGKQSNAPSIVFVHGSPGSLSAFEPYLSDTSLSSIANLIAVDRLGFGYSGFGEPEGSLTRQAKLIAEVLKAAGQGKKILVGHSMACPVLAKLAMDFPYLADGLLMIAPPISPELEPSNTWRKILDFPLIRWFTPPALRVCNQEIIPLKEELEKLYGDWDKIRIPVAVIQGEEDTLVPKENAVFARKMLSNSPEVKVKIIEGGNHFILWSEVPFITDELKKLYHLVNSQN